ncbi:MAG: glycosyltransferase [Verrucomicrobiota bacterium]|nr:glycosyltransferase [Verrucomicrobiota bacterium]
MHRFCTYCDKGYAARLLCLHASLRAQGEAFVLYVLCLDAPTEAAVRAEGAPSLVAIPWREVLEADPAYAAVRAQRSPVEFIFTTTPVLVRHCLARDAAADSVTYLDADLYFFGPASAVFQRQADASVGIVPHRFPAHLREREKYGRFNVAWVSFRRDAAGLEALGWWRERCLEWCHDRVEDGRFADQGYLDEFPRRFGGVAILDHPGINAAPWNMAGQMLEQVGAEVRVNGEPLLFYHFQGIRELRPGWFEPGLRQYRAPLDRSLRALVYEPYLKQLVRVQGRLQREQGIAPRFEHQRLNAGTSWRDRWERCKARWVQPYLGRWRGRLVCVREETA